MTIQLECKKIVGPNGKWWIDENGNMFLAGNLVIEEGLDPTFFTLDSQSSITTNNTIGVESNVLKYRNNVGSESNVQFGDDFTAPPDVVQVDTDTNVVQSGSTGELDTIITLPTAALTSSSNEWLIFGGYVWGSQSSEIMNIEIVRATTQIAEPVDQNTTSSTSDTMGGGGFMIVHAPGTTASAVYSAETRKSFPSGSGSITFFGGSMAMMEIRT